ncbi:OpgC domain-containing protein, partial [Candidatus Saccharibacteria bacterium]|nr:OpgC domain-containing protein [Candidatus Saccharibacteria bacterium]
WAIRGNNFTLSWQIVFAIGMVIGFYWHEFKALLSRYGESTHSRIRRAIYVAAGITFALSYASVYLLSVLNQKLIGLPLWLQHFTFSWNTVNADVWLYAQKWTMGPIRIFLFMLWFSALYLIVERHYETFNKYSRGFVELLGQNSLFVYITHAFIVFAFKFFIPAGTTLWQNFLITGFALTLLILITAAYKKYYGRGTAAHQKVARIKQDYLKIETAKSS